MTTQRFHGKKYILFAKRNYQDINILPTNSCTTSGETSSKAGHSTTPVAAATVAADGTVPPAAPSTTEGESKHDHKLTTVAIIVLITSIVVNVNIS